MPRNILDEAHIHPAIRERIINQRAVIVREVRAAVAANNVVVVGMKQNPHPKRACKSLDTAGVPYKSIWLMGVTLAIGGGATHSRCGPAGPRFR
jgi:hypothetical protein